MSPCQGEAYKRWRDDGGVPPVTTTGIIICWWPDHQVEFSQRRCHAHGLTEVGLTTEKTGPKSFASTRNGTRSDDIADAIRTILRVVLDLRALSPSHGFELRNKRTGVRDQSFAWH